MNSPVSDNSSKNQPDTESDNAAPRSGSKPPESGSRWIIFGAVALVFLPVLFHCCRGETNRWRAAAAMERYLDGEKEQAIEELQALSEQLPLDYRIKLTLASWYFENYQAEQALELLDQLPEPMRSTDYMALRRNCLIALDRGDEAIQVYRQANPVDAKRNELQLLQHRNSLAYFSALAGRELPLSLQNANFVIAARASEWASRHELNLNARLQTALCAGLIYRNEINRPENDQAAKLQAEHKGLEILSDVIDELHTEYSISCNVEDELITQEYEKRTESQGADGPKFEKPSMARIREDAAAALAIFRTVRALVLQDLHQLAESVEDREVVRTLGFMPEEIAERLPDFDECVRHATTMASILDTRGCVFFQLARFQNARGDLNLSIIAQEALVKIADHTDRTRVEASLDPRQQNEKYVLQPQKALAVFLYHRSWIWKAYQKELAAEILKNPQSELAVSMRLQEEMSIELEQKDLDRIRELGFRPGPYLF